MTFLLQKWRRMAACWGALFFIAASGAAIGQEVSEPTQEEIDAYTVWAEEFESGLDRKQGTIKILGGKVKLVVPAEYYFLNAEDGRSVLEEAWGNPPNEGVLGMIFPSHYSPLDDESWGAIIYWEGDGYVSDEDANEIDYDELLVEMQKSIQQDNEYRVEMGYEPLELVGWAEPPVYDGENHRMYWAQDLIFGESEDHTLNYDMRILGRRGVLTLSYVAAMDQLEEVRASRDDLLRMTSFAEGSRYTDYQPGDKKADYGIAALVGGGAGVLLAKKAGLFGVIMIFFKKFFVFILAGLAFLFTRLKGLFGGNKS